MVQWSARPTEDGRWNTLNGNFQDWSSALTTSASLRFATRYDGVDVPQGTPIISANIKYTVTGGTSPTALSAFLGDDAPLMDDLPRDGPFTAEGFTQTGITRTYDVTDTVQTIIDRPGWVSGNAITFLLRRTLTSGANLEFAFAGDPNAALLTIEFEDPAEGESTFGFKFGATATGSAPVVPPALGTSTFGFKFGGTAEGLMPAAPGANGEATFNFEVAYGAGGERRSVGGTIMPFKVDSDQFGLRDSLAESSFDFQIDLTLTSSQPPVPPPPPWQELTADPRYEAALTARHATIDARVDVLNTDGTVIESLGGPDATLPGAVGGSVEVNSTSQSWWTCNLQIDNSELLPTKAGDLLHPLTHNRLRVWWRILLAPGTWAEIPVGTYFVQWPTATDDGGANISLAVEGRDATAELSRAQMQNSVDVGGLTITQAIEQLLDEYAPWVEHSIEEVDHKLPKEYEAGEPGDDPLTVVRELGRTAGLKVHADRLGRIVGRRTPDRMANPVAEFVEGPSCAVTSAGVAVPMDNIANRVRITATAREDEDGEELDPFTVTVQVDDETSPLWVGHGFYYDHSTDSDAVTTEEQARSMGQGILTEKTALVEDIELLVFPYPHLDPFDTVATTISRVGLDGMQEVVGWSLALGDLGGQRLTLTSRREH